MVIQDNTSYLNIQGSFNNAAEIARFVSQLSGCKTEYLEIVFLDARMLPAEVIIAIQKAMTSEQYKKVKISVFYRYLSSYLSRLGIRNFYQSSTAMHQIGNKTIKAIVIGGSAGSLDKILSIMSRLPLAEVSVFIVQHILEKAPNYLNELLKERTAYNVATITDGCKIEPGHVYIAPPAYHMSIEKGKIHLSDDDKINYARPSISRLFESTAKLYGRHLIAVLLCGYGSDGTSALESGKQHGATIIIEDPEECDAKEMLLNAWKTGLIDYKFPLPEIISYLSRMVIRETPEISNSDLPVFLAAVNEKYGYNYLRYEKESLKRRIKHGMSDLNIQSFSRFKELVLNDEEMFEFLFLEFSINVTDLFRNPEIYKVIREYVLPYLASFPHIKVWSAGCSTGLEPYSLAITLEEVGLLQKTQIYASDINPFVVEEAKNGLLPGSYLEKAEQNYLAAGGSQKILSYFRQVGQPTKTAQPAGTMDADSTPAPAIELVQLKESILNKILFFQHSLLNPGSFHEFQLILCRNVLIYFDKDLQMQVMKLFAQSLDLNGFLILGKNEVFASGIPDFKLVDKAHNIYKRIL